MKKLMLFIATIGCLALFTVPTHAQGVMSSDSLLRRCTDVANVNPSVAQEMDFVSCTSFITGSFTMLELMQNAVGAAAVCPPRAVDGYLLARMYINYMAAHQDRKYKAAETTVFMMLVTAWPCSTKTYDK